LRQLDVEANIKLGYLFVADEHDDGILRRVPPKFCPLADSIIARCRTRYDGALFSIVLIWLKVTRGHISQGEGLSVLV